jgi:hypothetical protein
MAIRVCHSHADPQTAASDPQVRATRRRWLVDIEEISRRQDGVVTRLQALDSLTTGALQHRLGKHWQILLPGVYLTSTGGPSPRQQLRAALLYGGPEAQIADTTALRAYGVRYLPSEQAVRLLLPATDRRVNPGWRDRPPQPSLTNTPPAGGSAI